MATLHAPGPDTRMVRRLPGGDRLNPGKWHFLRNKDSHRKCLCGLLIDSMYGVEYKTLGQVQRKDVCPTCWPFQ